MSISTQNWRSGKVVRGDQTGRTLGFPTVNFNPELAGDLKQEGVYAASVLVDGINYRGALYFGPRLTLGETKNVLEIHLIDFSGDVYDTTLQFQIGTFIRPPMNFASVDEIKQQLADDILAARGAAI